MLFAALKASVFAMIMAIGMCSSVAEVSSLLRRPGKLSRSLVAMYILVPAAALAIAKFMPVSRSTAAALLVLAASSGAPLLPRKLGAFEDGGYGVSLVVTSSLLAIVLVPLWLGALARHFGVPTTLSVREVAVLLGKAILLPLALGMVVRAVRPERIEPLAERVSVIGGGVLAGSGVALLASHLGQLPSVGWRGIAALAVFLGVALAIGHVLGGPEPADRTVLAVACASRHIAVAVLVATSFPGPHTAVLVSSYVLTTAAVTLPYLAWRRGSASSATAA